MSDSMLKGILSPEIFSSSDIDLFAGALQEIKVKKGDILLRAGQVCRHLYYIHSGLMMVYEINNGQEIPYCFMAEQEWVGLLKSFNGKLPAEKTIRALEDSILFRISARDLEHLFQAQPRFIGVKNSYLEQRLLEVARHSADLRKLDARTRYYKFMEDKPGLISRIPQYHIAAYLGVKPQSISRIRKKTH